MRRAKIVCTLGPATEGPEAVLGLVNAGMNVARINMSHGTHEDHLRSIKAVRLAADETGRGIGVLVDLQGPKIRLGTFGDGPHTLAPGDRFTITTDDVVGTRERCSTTYKGLPGDVAPGDFVLVDDGRVSLRVTALSETDVDTVVIEGGPVSNNKGINLPGVAVSVPALSDKDVTDLRWALGQGIDMVALSFVRSAQDAQDVRDIMEEVGVRAPILAKIEKPQAVDALEEIIHAFDGIMVARGDLGVELRIEQVPLVQKQAIQLARALAKPVIVATQMLDSMMTSSRPTRAEASDVANAVLDGADALMLSGETSVGIDPAHVVETMATIISHVEEEALSELPERPVTHSGSTARAVTWAACRVGENIGAKYLCTFTETGKSARLVSRQRNAIPILAFTPSPHVRNWLSLVWGVEAFQVPRVSHTDEMVLQIDHALLSNERANQGDSVLVIAGVPPGIPGTTNGLRVHKVGTGADA